MHPIFMRCPYEERDAMRTLRALADLRFSEALRQMGKEKALYLDQSRPPQER